MKVCRPCGTSDMDKKVSARSRKRQLDTRRSAFNSSLQNVNDASEQGGPSRLKETACCRNCNTKPYGMNNALFPVKEISFQRSNSIVGVTAQVYAPCACRWRQKCDLRGSWQRSALGSNRSSGKWVCVSLAFVLERMPFVSEKLR